MRVRTMLASRLLSILMLLQTRGRMSANALAAEFEVSVRTIYRDIDQLSAAGVPVYADRGRSGGFQLMDGYRTKLTGMTQPEAESIFLAGLPGPAAQLGLSDVLAAARLKLMAALPANVQPGVERIAARFHLDPVAWFRGADPLPALKPVARAVWDGVQLRLRYQPAGEAEARTRTVGPLGLVLKGGVWYLVAQVGASVRTYRVASIETVEVLQTPFERLKDFDLAAFWAQSSSAYEAGLYREFADVRLSPRGRTLARLMGAHVAEAVDAAGAPDAQGWLRCRLPIEGISQAVRELMRLGEEAEVLGPPALRSQMIETLARTAGLYAASG